MSDQLIAAWRRVADRPDGPPSLRIDRSALLGLVVQFFLPRLRMHGGHHDLAPAHCRHSFKTRHLPHTASAGRRSSPLAGKKLTSGCSRQAASRIQTGRGLAIQWISSVRLGGSSRPFASRLVVAVVTTCDDGSGCSENVVLA